MESLKEKERTTWYREAKFGLFIHWGIHSVAGVEASWPIMSPGLNEAFFGKQKKISEQEYLALASSFNPSRFDAGEWVNMAVDAGVRYIIITAKHHDGFCMFDAPGTDFKITNTEFGRDICAELSAACEKQNIRLGFYYSPPDMHHPGYRDISKRATSNWTGEPQRQEWGSYLDYMESHIRCLLTNFGNVSLLWFDSLTNYVKYDPPRFQALIQELKPDTLINDRLCAQYDFIVAEQFFNLDGIPVKTGKPPAMYSSGDELMGRLNTLTSIPILRRIVKKKLRDFYSNGEAAAQIPIEASPTEERFQPWETCMTMNRTWGYNPTDLDWKSTAQLLEALVSVNAHAGNFLLNIGPKPDGTIPDEEQSRLKEIGRWVRENGFASSLYEAN